MNKTFIIFVIFVSFYSFKCDYVNTSTNSANSSKILPFTSLKIDAEDQIFITIDNDCSKWQKLLSIDNIGSDAIIKESRDHYGNSKCDFGIPCYKYNIIANFEHIYKIIQEAPLPKTITIEVEYDNKMQNGMDLECTQDKYNINQEHLEKNIKMSLDYIKVFGEKNKSGTIFTGFKDSVSKIFSDISQPVAGKFIIFIFYFYLKTKK